MKLKKSLTYGSNFGFQSHFKSIIKLKKYKYNFIYSPSAHKKKNLDKKFLLSKDQIKSEKFDLISIATPPVIQNYICRLNIKKAKYFFLEKPLTENYAKTLKLFKHLKENKIKYYLNFIFPKIKSFKVFYDLIKDKKIVRGIYTWKFKQGYFVNYRQNWKISNSQGGGLVNFYLIHVFYNLLYLIGQFKIVKVICKKKKILEEIIIYIKTKKNFSMKIEMNINSSSTIHQIVMYNIKDKFELRNKSKNWVKNFKLYKNNKNISVKDEKNLNREYLTYLNLKSLFEKRKTRKELKFFELAHFYCNEINKTIGR